MSQSLSYYQQLYNTINELEIKGLKPSYTLYPSTINNYRKSKFIKTIKTKIKTIFYICLLYLQ